MPWTGYGQSKFFICEYDGVKFLTKLAFYHKTSAEIHGISKLNVMSQADAEINILKILKEKITDKGISPCILEIVSAEICENVTAVTLPSKVCERLLIDYRGDTPSEIINHLFCEYKDLVKNGLAHDKYAFMVLDQCDMTLHDYLIRSLNTPVSLAVLKTLIFQIIFTFYQISKMYPKFRHYDLHADNVMLKFDNKYAFRATDPKFLSYTVDGKEFHLPYFGIIPKIIDFGFSMIPEEGIVSNIVEDKLQMYMRSDNDLILLFHYIYHIVLEYDKSVSVVDEILYSLEPNRSYVHYYTEYIRKIEKKLPTYFDMINNPIWNEYVEYRAQPSQIYQYFGEAT